MPAGYVIAIALFLLLGGGLLLRKLHRMRAAVSASRLKPGSAAQSLQPVLSGDELGLNPTPAQPTGAGDGDETNNPPISESPGEKAKSADNSAAEHFAESQSTGQAEKAKESEAAELLPEQPVISAAESGPVLLDPIASRQNTGADEILSEALTGDSSIADPACEHPSTGTKEPEAGCLPTVSVDEPVHGAIAESPAIPAPEMASVRSSGISSTIVTNQNEVGEPAILHDDPSEQPAADAESGDPTRPFLTRDLVVADENASALSSAPEIVASLAEIPAANGISKEAGLKRPRQYKFSVPAPAPKPRPVEKPPSKAKRRSYPLGIAVRLLFEHGGFCTITLLPARNESLPDAITATGHEGKVNFLQFTDAWYQDFSPPDLGNVLVTGAEWVARHDGLSARWSLGGRKIFVLSKSDVLSGLVAVNRENRVNVGESHAVLCHASISDQALAVLADARANIGRVLGEDMGVPKNWNLYCDVTPQRSLPAEAGDDILNALRPGHDTELLFEGGIPILQASYLAGHPPKIRIKGLVIEGLVLLIDGIAATRHEDGSFTAPGWDLPGQHSIWYGSNSSYSIVHPATAAGSWSAHTFKLGGSGRVGITGALVHECSAPNNLGCNLVPKTNPLLLGHVPGEIYACSSASDNPSALAVAFAGFEYVWALPADPLSADKKTARVRLLGRPLPVSPLKTRPRSQHAAVLRWSDAILRASQKRLPLSDGTPEFVALWASYVKTARSIRRLKR